MLDVNTNNLTCMICSGFNIFFDVPKIDGMSNATYRMAVVIKKRNVDDEWEVYDSLFWRMVQRLSMRCKSFMAQTFKSRILGLTDRKDQW